MAYSEEFPGFVEDDEPYGEQGQPPPGQEEAARRRGRHSGGRTNGLTHGGRTGGTAAPDWELITYGDRIEPSAPDYLVKGVVNRGEFSAWFGPPKGGKSFVLLDLVLHVASGRSWRGRRVRRGRVLYLALEGGNGIRNRLVAAQGKFGLDRLPLHVLTVPLDLLNGDAGKLLAFIQAKAAELGGRFDAIVLDTLSRSMPGGNENAPETMTKLVGVLDRLRAATGAHVAVVHHTGKDTDRGMRGHSSLLGAVDMAVEIKERTIRIGDARECPEGDAWGFELEAVTIGTDDDGDPITSCVIRETDADAAPKAKAERKARPLGDNERTVLECVDRAIADHGKRAVDAGAIAPDIPSRAMVVRWPDLERVAERYLDKPGFRLRESVNRAMASLQARKVVRHVKLGEEVWLWRVLFDASHDTNSSMR